MSWMLNFPKQSINRLIPITISNCILDKTFPCTNGAQYREFIFIDDVISAIIKCLTTKKKILGQVFNLGSGKPLKVKDVIKKISGLTKKGNPQYGKLKMRKDETLRIFPDINKIKNILDWRPKTSFKEGLKKTFKFYKKNLSHHSLL